MNKDDLTGSERVVVGKIPGFLILTLKKSALRSTYSNSFFGEEKELGSLPTRHLTSGLDSFHMEFLVKFLDFD